MIFKKVTREELKVTREKWERDIERLEEADETVRPSLYWSALDAASARIGEELESLQYGLYENHIESNAIALVAVHPVLASSAPYLKVREIRLEPSLGYDLGDGDGEDYFSRHKKITEIVGSIIAEVLVLATDEYGMNKIKIYGSTQVEIEMFTNVVAHSKHLEESWGVRASAHGHWLQFEKS
jgi:hypothetical protein|tara:strand:+ start:168 stop:716 length:549 start_codon:yes stop_codon:yes gene_type:complete